MKASTGKRGVPQIAYVRVHVGSLCLYTLLNDPERALGWAGSQEYFLGLMGIPEGPPPSQATSQSTVGQNGPLREGSARSRQLLLEASVLGGREGQMFSGVAF